MKHYKYKLNLIFMADKYVYAKDTCEAEKIIKQELVEQYTDLGLDFIGSKITWTGQVTDNDREAENFNKTL